MSLPLVTKGVIVRQKDIEIFNSPIITPLNLSLNLRKNKLNLKILNTRKLNLNIKFQG